MSINAITCTPGEAFKLLKDAYEKRLPIFLWGKPGVGKSDIIRQFVAEHNMKLEDLRLTTMDAPDLRGLQWIDEKTGVTKSYRPEWFPIVNEPGVIFLDELTAAEQRMQATTYQLVLDRRIGPHVLPSKWWVLGAGNAPEDGAISYRMGSALADRFVHIHVVANPQDWLKWAQANNIHPAVISFIKVKPEYLDTVAGQKATNQLICPSPRSWARVSSVMDVNDTEARRLLIQGIVGEAAYVEFSHIAEEIAELPSIELLLEECTDGKSEKAAKRIPNKVASLYGLAYSLTQYVKTTEDFEASIDLFEALSNIKKENAAIPRAELQTMAMEMLFEKSEKLGVIKNLSRTAAYKRYLPKAAQLTGK